MKGFVRTGKRIIRGARRASPYILTGTAIIGVGTTAALAVKATPAAMNDLRVATDKKQTETGDPNARLTKAEAVKVAAPHYIPAGISGLITSGCMMLSTHISMKRAAACASIATAAQTALNEYTDKVAEKFGKEKEQEIHDELAVEKMKSNPLPVKGCAVEMGDGDHLFFFVPHNVWFRSSYEGVRRRLNDFNAEYVTDKCGKSENELLDKLYHGSDSNGEIYGFPPLHDDDTKKFGKRSIVELRFTEYLNEDGGANTDYNLRYIMNGEAATAIDYLPWCEPEYGWDC